MSQIFDAPPEGALQTTHERALLIEYKANKTPENYAHVATDAAIADYVKNGALGFSYFNKDENKRFAIPEFTFIVLEVYAGVSGFDGDNRISYWSNRAKDTRKEPIAVFASNHTGPLCSGLYQQIKEQLPKAANYTKFVRAYCVQLDKVVEIKLTASAERGMQKGIATAEANAGRTKSKWESVFILGLADNDHLWGFHLTGYNREQKDGSDYAGKGELYFAPVFHAGVLNAQKQAAIHAKCRELQEAERAAHEAYKAKYSQPEAASQATHTPQAEYRTPPAASVDFPTVEMQTDNLDLPF